MSGLHLAQIQRYLEERFFPHLDFSGAQQEHHKLSRAVAALTLSERTGLPDRTAGLSVTDHSKDGGIDGIAYAADRSTLVIVQSKWTGSANSGIELGDVLKFIDGVRLLVNNDWSGFGGPIVDRRSEIEDILFHPGTRLELILATTGTHDLEEQQKSALDNFCGQMNDATEIANWTYLNQERVYSSIASLGNAQIDLDVNLRNWGIYQEGHYVAYYGTASAQEVVKWYQDHGNLLFSRNIRGALSGTDINEAITSTAQEDPSRFWFFSNGITVISETFDKSPHVNQKSGNFTFRRSSVVNGAQTVSSLARAATNTPELLESADVFIRFVTVEDPDGDFARLVTRRTNTQNRVGGREFVALDPEQERYRMEFAVSGLRYAYRSGETVTDPLKGCDLTDATIALACAQGINETVLAKREISRLWEDTTRPPYKALFNPSVSGSQIWIAVELMREVDRALEAKREDTDGRDRLIVVHGNRLLLWAIMHFLELKKVKSTHDFNLPFTTENIRTVTEIATSQLLSIVAAHYPDSYPQPLFKNQTKCRDIGNRLIESLEDTKETQ
ncbi:AIPR family protein [Nocardiopsis sp. NPDC050513]|uniref:AIPR family protein n=1 Tax=Nocardiopsis sp. NPDC050513 TaxID=3364338 RepID=UPI0037934833